MRPSSITGSLSMFSRVEFRRGGKRHEIHHVKVAYRLKAKESLYALFTDGSIAFRVNQRETTYPRQEFLTCAYDLLSPEMSQQFISHTLSQLGILSLVGEDLCQPILNFSQSAVREGVGNPYNVLIIEVSINMKMKYFINMQDMVDWAVRESENVIEQSRGFGSVPATSSAIAALKTHMFKKQAEDSDNTCMVCLEEIVEGSPVKQLPCQHIYHGQCIVHWLRVSNSCPVCRFVVQDEVPSVQAS